MTVLRPVYQKLYKNDRIFINIKCVFELTRPPTWAFHRSLHMSGILLKKVKDVSRPVYEPKSKFKQIPTVEVWKNMTVNELATALNKSIDELFEVMSYVSDTANYKKAKQTIDDFKVIEGIVKKLGRRCKIIGRPGVIHEVEKVKDVTRRSPSEYIDLRSRPPVVTIMGHVDHGKTTLLDYLRHSHIVESEFGGITQHIGAFSVLINGKERVSFLDTPGHAAFCSMRNRGAQCTDIVILVVAADDGVMEQTVESIKMAKEANVPIIVAINKIDKPKANVEGVKNMLMQYGIQVEDLSGDIQSVAISALKGTNIDALMDAILTQAELMELKSDFKGPVEGVVVESSTDTHRGKLCTMLVQCGTLKKSNILVAGRSWCKVRAMFSDTGEILQEVTPSRPAQILGWKDLPFAGDIVLQVPSEKRASEVIEMRKEQRSLDKMKEDKMIIEEKMKEHYIQYRTQLELKRKLGRFWLKPEGPRKKEIQPDSGEPRLNIILKGDVVGSIEAILDVLDTYNSQLCQLDVVHYGVGPVSKNDIVLAESFNALIYIFNTDILEDVKLELKNKSLQVKKHNVIYKLIDDLKSEINKRLLMKDVEEVLGEANVLQEFIINEGKSKIPVAGCKCIKGTLKKSALFKIIRSEETVFNGSLASLKHFKDEVEVVKKDAECGLKITDTSINFKPGDSIICYRIKQTPQVTDWDPGF